MADRTKQLLADTIQALAKEKPIRRIQVKELCEACGIDRTTFYHHFCDKYELIAWIYEQFFLEEAQTALSLNDEEMLGRINRRIWKKRNFFLNALLDDSQNNLRQYMLEFYARQNKAAILSHLGVDALDEETDILLTGYLYACMGNIIRWLTGELSLTPERIAYYQYKYMPEVLKAALRNPAAIPGESTEGAPVITHNP